MRDRDGDGDAGLDDTGFDNDSDTQADADYHATQDGYNVFWNISEDSLLNDTRTVNVIVTWMDHGAQKGVSMQHIIPKMN